MMVGAGIARAATGSARHERQHDEAELGELSPQQDFDDGKTPSEAQRYAARGSEIVLSGEIRAGFVRKVYGILAAQMTLTTVVCAIAMLVPSVRGVVTTMMRVPYMSVAIFVPTLCVLCALQSKKAEHPTNYYLLWAFTLLMSFNMAGICALYQEAGLGSLILQAFAMTAACFFGLTAYAMKSGQNFGWMGGFLSMGLMGMIMFSLMGSVFGFSGGILMSLFGVVLFCGFIVYDTQRVMQVYGPDDAILASIELYLDILNLFLQLLELLSRMSSDN